MFRYIYKITNLLNGKVYVGKHTCDRIENLYFGSGVAIKRAIKKYGKDNFKKEIVCVCDTEEKLNDAEIHWIEKFGSFGDGYNLTKGGEGLLGRKLSPSEIERARSSRIEFYKNNPESRNNLSEIAKKRLGSKNPFYGKKLTQEHINKMTLARVKAMTGENNPSSVKVKCVETGVIYNTAKNAAESVGLKYSTTILKAAKGYRRKAGGYSWELV